MNAYLIHSKFGSLEKLRSLYRGNIFEKKKKTFFLQTTLTRYTSGHETRGTSGNHGPENNGS